jgi:hypothetical protein
MRKPTRLLNLFKRVEYCAVVLVSHSATIRTWPIARNGSRNGSTQ